MLFRFPELMRKTSPSCSALRDVANHLELFSVLTVMSKADDAMNCPYDFDTLPLNSDSFCSFESEESSDESWDHVSDTSDDSVTAGLPPLNPVIESSHLSRSIDKMNRCLSLSNATTFYIRSLETPMNESRILGLDVPLEIGRQALNLNNRMLRVQSTPLVKSNQINAIIGPLHRIWSSTILRHHQPTVDRNSTSANLTSFTPINPSKEEQMEVEESKLQNG